MPLICCFNFYWVRDHKTVQHINTQLQSANLLTDEIKRFSDGLSHYRSLIKLGRHRVVSHLDKESIVNSVSIGDYDQEEVTAFFKNLYGYIDAVGNTIGVGPLDFRTTAGAGDVLDLIKVLSRSTTSPVDKKGI
jgi:hypothetical protein